MRRGRWFASVAVVVLGAAGLAVATPAPVPEADPIGDVIANSPPTQSDPGVIAPASPLSPTEGLLTETPAIEVTEDRAEEEGTTEMPLGTPLPELADPLPRSRQGFAIVQALDKVTAETIRFAVPVGQQRRWRGLIFSARACESTAPDEPMRDSMAYLEIFSQPRGHDGVGEPREIFQGWMFASSPGLNPVEHPLYDAWVIACQAEAPSAA